VENYLSLPEQWLQWNCLDDCKYQCMWRTTSAYLSRNWDVPQFYGKWPFVRFLGLQEPASVVFSLLNLAAHYYLFNKFRRKVRPDAPLFWTWNLFSLVCMNAWIWSTVFHARDYPVTEIFDYIFAYSMVLSSFYCMLMRLIHRKSKIVQSTVSLSCFIFFVNHFKYLIVGRFDYNYNMKANLVTGERRYKLYLRFKNFEI
jgi:post-GPI attachment to proteins factor 3